METSEKIGRHLSINKNNLLKLKDIYKKNPVQVFIGSPLKHNSIEDIQKSIISLNNLIFSEYHKFFEEHNVYIHNSYVSNIHNTKFVPDSFIEIFNWASKVNIKGYVIHIPSYSQDIDIFIKNISLLPKKLTILLEIIDNKGKRNNAPERVKDILYRCREIRPNTKLCIDTAHLYMSGYSDIEEYMSEFKKTDIGLIHLNGCNISNSDSNGNYKYPGKKHSDIFSKNNKFDIKFIVNTDYDKIIENNETRDL